MKPKTSNGSLRKAVQIMSASILIPTMASADFLGPPRIYASDDDYVLVQSLCNSSLSKNEQDVTFYAPGPDMFFYQSAARTQHIDGKEYQATYLINPRRNECLGVIYAHGEPLFGSTLHTRRSRNSETVVLLVPDGRVEVTSNGTVYKLD